MANPNDVFGRIRAAIDSRATLRIFALASVLANVGIVLTGGAVRLSQSGLGCPTWPKCTGTSLLPTANQAAHGRIEFTNRMLTAVVVAVAIVTLIVALRQRRHDGRLGRRRSRLALAIFLGIPAQAVLGGITVLTDLNPWLVGSHFLLSMALIALSVLLLDAVAQRPTVYSAAMPSSADPAGDEAGGRQEREILASMRVVTGWLIVGATAAVLVLGTVVTGSGPHAGATDADGVARRIGISPASITQAHADAVMVLLGLTIGAVILARRPRARAARPIGTAALVLLGLEISQGVVGYVQYFTHVPALLVGVHMLGACLVWIAALRALLQAQAGRRAIGGDTPTKPVDDQLPETVPSAPSWAHGVSAALSTSAPGTSA
jgi:cytochrome c oxidase assembly protein subunit 15